MQIHSDCNCGCGFTCEKCLTHVYEDGEMPKTLCDCNATVGCICSVQSTLDLSDKYFMRSAIIRGPFERNEKELYYDVEFNECRDSQDDKIDIIFYCLDLKQMRDFAAFIGNAANKLESEGYNEREM